MKLYLDASALVKRYVDEQGSAEVREAMLRASGWHMNRIGFVETARAISLGTDGSPLRYFEQDWSVIDVIDVDQRLSRLAVSLAVRHQLKSLDAVHLASALILPADDLAFATWDRQLHRAAQAEGLATVPPTL